MLTIVIPVYNSEKSLPLLVDRIIAAMLRENLQYEIILVNDGSSDNSLRVIRQLCTQNKAITGINLAGNYGQQNALLCGLRYGRGEYFITLDDDLQYQPEDIVLLLNKLQKYDYQVVYGIPHIKKHNPYRNIGTLLTDLLFTIMCHKPRHLKVGSFRIMSKSLVDLIVTDQSSRVYLSASILRFTTRIGNCTVDHKPRSIGKSNYSFKKLLRLYADILIYYGKASWLRRLRKYREQYIVIEVIR